MSNIACSIMDNSNIRHDQVNEIAKKFLNLLIGNIHEGGVNKMAEKPILFNTDMVRAILEGRKTQTRRVIKSSVLEKFINIFWNPNENIHHCLYRVGDTLWVRETWGICTADYENCSLYVVYKADSEEKSHKISFPTEKFEKIYNNLTSTDSDWKPSIHMPKEASRIKLLVKSVRVERLQDITDEDAIDEGIEIKSLADCLAGWSIRKFSELWDNIYTKQGYGWDINPWVWVIEFEVRLVTAFSEGSK